MKIQLKFSLLIPFLLVLFQTASYAATFTWTGTVNSAWNNSLNWSGPLFGVPNANDDVIIPTGQNNYPIIGRIGTQSITILSMVVESGATVTVNSQGTLIVSGASGDGIDNAGTITNNGIITIEDTGAIGLDNNSAATFTNNSTLNIGTNNQPTEDYGIRNTDATTSFQNNSIINIEYVNTTAILNLSSANFLNADGATIDIGQNDGNIGQNGIINVSIGTTFNNNGTINIDNTSGEGIENRSDAKFSNAANAHLNIGQHDGNIGGNGIFNVDSATVDNSGTINIDNTLNNGIRNQGSAIFNNTANAHLNIGQNDGNIDLNGIFNIDSATFDSSGIINIDNTSGDGIQNLDSSKFNNVINANLSIGQNDGNIGVDGIFNTNTSTFSNSGTINIDNTSNHGIESQNGSNFSNTADANLNIGQNAGNIGRNGIFNPGSGATFDNSGTVNIDNTFGDGIENLSGGNFSNAATANLNIGQNDGNIGQNGIDNSGSTFNNSGKVDIDNTSRDGILNQDGSNFSNAANANLSIGQNDGNIGLVGINNPGSGNTFDNSGTIEIDNTSSNGIVNRNAATFSNAANANLNIGQGAGNIGENGILNILDATFDNSGKITIDNTSINGISNQNDANFNNTANAILNIGQNAGNIGGRGILQALTRPGVGMGITNNGTLNVDNTESAGIQIVDGLFTGNENSAILNCVGDFIINSDGTVNITGVLELEGDWENDGGTFTANTSKVSINGTSESEIGGSASTTFNDLAINNAGNVVLGNNITVNGELTLTKGKVNLDDFDFILNGSFLLSNFPTESFLVTNGTGKFTRSVTTGNIQIFPVGNTNYTPLTIQNNGTSDDFSIQCLPEVLSDGTIGNVFPTAVVNTTWLIEEAVTGGTNTTLTVQWTSEEELSDFDRNSTFLSRYDGTAWDSNTPITASGTDPYTIARSGVTEFSPFAVGTSFVPDFDCVASGLELNEVVLASGTYSTQQSIESTNLIEASSTVDFIAANIIELKAGFHAESGSTFSAVISDCLPPINNEAIIEERTEIAAQPITRTALLFPNPAGQELNIRDGMGRAVIYNMLGQQIQAFEIRDQLHTLDVNALQSGQYVLVIFRENGKRVTLAFVK